MLPPPDLLLDRAASALEAVSVHNARTAGCQVAEPSLRPELQADRLGILLTTMTGKINM